MIGVIIIPSKTSALDEITELTASISELAVSSTPGVSRLAPTAPPFTYESSKCKVCTNKSGGDLITIVRRSRSLLSRWDRTASFVSQSDSSCFKLLAQARHFTFEDLLRIAGGFISAEDRLPSYEILLAHNSRLWQDIRDNNIRDENVYFGIGLPVTGLEVKSMLERPDARAFLLNRIKSQSKKWEEELRSYPSCNGWQVYQDRDDPPSYRITPSFQPAHTLLQALDIPISDAVFYLFIFRGDRLFNRGKKYQNYTVEEFGLSIKAAKFNPDTTPLFRIPNPQMPDPSLYKAKPRYWTINGDERLIQVWRSRVFACPITCIETNVERPFCVPRSEVMYFEETWNPRRGYDQSIKGTQHAQHSSSRDLTQFFRDARRILGRKVRGTALYETADELRKDLDGATSRIAIHSTKRAGRETYAAELNIDRKTLTKYLNRFGLSLPRPSP